jgi:hypothetical protein
LCMVGIKSPINRPDLVRHAEQLTFSSAVKNLLDNVNNVPNYGSDDDRAILLYTAESPIYYIVNGALSQVGCTEADLYHIAPFTKRLYHAIQKLGRPFRGRGFRALLADAPPLCAAFNEYATHFKKGNPVNLFQFLSFTQDPTSIKHITKSQRPIILLKCDDLIGFDIDDLSYQVRSGASREREVMVLPPAYFTVKTAPYKVHDFVIVDLMYHEEVSREGSFMGADRDGAVLAPREQNEREVSQPTPPNSAQHSWTLNNIQLSDVPPPPPPPPTAFNNIVGGSSSVRAADVVGLIPRSATDKRKIVHLVATRVDGRNIDVISWSSYVMSGDKRLNATLRNHSIPSHGNTERRVLTDVSLPSVRGTVPIFCVHITEATDGSTPSAKRD